MHCVRAGMGRPLLLLHGLGGSWRSWAPVMPALRQCRDVVAVDLPGFGESTPLAGLTSLATMADAVTEFLGAQGLFGVDVAGVSMGARLGLELARRGAVGTTVALAPEVEMGGFGGRTAWWRYRARQKVLRSAIGGSAWSRRLLFRGLVSDGRGVGEDTLRDEAEDLMRARALRAMVEALRLTPVEGGGALKERRVVLGWGRRDRVCGPRQARRLSAVLGGVPVEWFAGCGHSPHWERPEETAELILRTTAP